MQTIGALQNGEGIGSHFNRAAHPRGMQAGEITVRSMETQDRLDPGHRRKGALERRLGLEPGQARHPNGDIGAKPRTGLLQHRRRMTVL